MRLGQSLVGNPEFNWKSRKSALSDIACFRIAGGSRATSMRRPAPVKPFFLGRANRTADCRPTGGTVSLQSFLLRKVFLRLPIPPTADQREAHNAVNPNSQITDSPYFHPHSLWSYCSGASWVSSIGNGCCRLGPELNVSVFQRRRSWRVPQSPELGDLD